MNGSIGTATHRENRHLCAMAVPWRVTNQRHDIAMASAMACASGIPLQHLVGCVR